MIQRGEKDVGRVTIEIELTNAEDLVLVKYGALAPDKVRRLRMAGVVDTGANHLVLPTATAKQLGVPATSQVAIRYADHRRSSRSMVENVRVDLLGRHGNFKAILEPKRTDVLIGAIVLEDLDLVVDCSTQTLYPRDPKRITSEIE
ncbi:MAG: aspartyl protease family protein [Gemmataceae bacterium]